MQALRCYKNVPIEMEIYSHCNIRQNSRLRKCRYGIKQVWYKLAFVKKQESKQNKN